MKHKIQNFWNELNPVTQAIALVGISLMVLGKLFVFLNIYFFWESFHIGYVLAAGSIGIAFIHEILIRIRILGLKDKKNWRIILRTLFVVLVIGVESLFLLSSSWQAIKEEIKKDEEIAAKLGPIIGFGWFISGTSSIITDSDGKHEYEIYEVLIKGSKKYKHVSVSAERHNSEEWTLTYSE